ncbi:hypothetical protein ACTQ3M_03120 [Oscillospiraceae bacterium LCP25S3_E10]|nr:hypothetical protein [Ruminococcus sp.]MDD6447695.1 hypothetical protein [Ruminococcus sp.]MDY2856774.1 hypothetical protein [Oscillospiraceae bacterium]
MAFFSMMLVFGAAALVILALMLFLFVLGALLLILGIIFKVRKQSRSKTYPVVLITVGSVILGLLLLFVVFLVLLGNGVI